MWSDFFFHFQQCDYVLSLVSSLGWFYETTSVTLLSFKAESESQSRLVVTHPGQGEIHLHLRHPLPHARSHADTKRDEAVRLVPVQARCRPCRGVTGHPRAEPALRDELLCIRELCLVMADCKMTQMELSLKRKNDGKMNTNSTLC